MKKISKLLISAIILTSSLAVNVFAYPMQKGQTMIPWNQNTANHNDFAQENSTSSASSPSDIILSDVTNTAKNLLPDTNNAATITMSDENSQIEISNPGTYILTGNCSDGNISVKKGTAGVILILDDLTLTSSTGAPLLINKNSEVQIIIKNKVVFTDNEDINDEESTDEAVAEAFDGACIKTKSKTSTYVTGTGTLTLYANCKNGFKSNDDAATSLTIDGPTINVYAANDAFNAGYDLDILSGTINIEAGDDAIHADHILTIGDENSCPDITIKKSEEGLEGTVVNIQNGNINVTSADDGINAANSDATYETEMEYSINITGGTTTLNTSGDGLDSNGNINLIKGSLTIQSASTGGEAGIDYDGTYYISKDFVLNNKSGISNIGGMPQNNMTRPSNNDQNTAQMPWQNNTNMPENNGNFYGNNASANKPDEMQNENQKPQMQFGPMQNNNPEFQQRLQNNINEILSGNMQNNRQNQMQNVMPNDNRFRPGQKTETNDRNMFQMKKQQNQNNRNR